LDLAIGELGFSYLWVTKKKRGVEDPYGPQMREPGHGCSEIKGVTAREKRTATKEGTFP